jgi:hypothetical protein
MTTVFPGISKSTNDLVVTYLAVNGRGTVAEIRAGTGISKSQVHNVIRQNPLISEIPTGKRAKTYRVDIEKLTESVSMPVVDTATKAVTYDEQAEDNLARVANASLDEQVAELNRIAVAAAGRLELVQQARHIAIALQTGRMEDRDQAMLVWVKALAELEKVKITGLILSGWTEQYLYDSRARTQEWWALFPKDKDKHNGR